jgi:hypothetical protein
MPILTNLPITAFVIAGLASCAGGGNDIGQGHHIATGAAVQGVCCCVDLTAIIEDTIAVGVPEARGVQHNLQGSGGTWDQYWVGA